MLHLQSSSFSNYPTLTLYLPHLKPSLPSTLSSLFPLNLHKGGEVRRQKNSYPHDEWADHPAQQVGVAVRDQALLALYRDTLVAWGKGR